MAEDAAYLAQYNGGSLVGAAVSFLVMTYISVGLRTFVRVFLTKSFLIDDWLMLGAQAVFTLSCTFVLLGIGTGLGRHNAALPVGEEITAVKWQALATATYILDMMLIKLSIGFFLLRIAVQKRYTYSIYICMVVVFIWSLVLFFWDVFECSPVQAQWNHTLPHFTCVSTQAIVNAAYALSVMTIVTDWFYALLPIPMVWKVKMTKQAKATVVIILGLGIFASIATLIRLKYLANLTDTSDLLFAATKAMIWTLVEPGVAIVASSLVTIRPLLRRIRLKGFESTENSRSKPHTSRSRSGTGGLGSKLSRSANQGRYSGMPDDYGPDDMNLRDLEQAYGKSHGFSSQETTLTSGASTSGGKTAWGGSVGVTLREEDEYMSPIGDAGEESALTSPSSHVLMVEGPKKTHQRQQPWRGETPQSAEDSDHIQGLTCPGSRRDAAGRLTSR